MRDIEIAKDILIKEELSLVVVKDAKVIFKSSDRGIKPMYYLSTEMKEKVMGASIADKVIGRGAALLSYYLNIKEVYSQLISQGAIDVFNDKNIPYAFDEFCEYIINRDKTDYCPIEKLAISADEAGEFLERLKSFFITNRKVLL